jgi:hypothetical protein
MARWYIGTAETSRNCPVSSYRLTALAVVAVGFGFAVSAWLGAGHDDAEAQAGHVILDTESSWRCFFIWTPPVFTEGPTDGVQKELEIGGGTRPPPLDWRSPEFRDRSWLR